MTPRRVVARWSRTRECRDEGTRAVAGLTREWNDLPHTCTGWNNHAATRYNALGWLRTAFYKEGVRVNATAGMCWASPRRKQREMKELFGCLPCLCF